MGLNNLPLELLSEIILQLPPSSFESLKIINKKCLMYINSTLIDIRSIPINHIEVTFKNKDEFEHSPYYKVFKFIITILTINIGNQSDGSDIKVNLNGNIKISKNELMINGDIIFNVSFGTINNQGNVNIIKNNDNFILDYLLILNEDLFLQVNGNVINNKLDGLLSISYYDNNHKYLDAMFKDDLLNGKYLLYYNNGNNNIEVECFYLNNELNGKYINYYQSGKKHYECVYINGHKKGKFTYYNDDKNNTVKYF